VPATVTVALGTDMPVLALRILPAIRPFAAAS
jgi:hypothetical protein